MYGAENCNGGTYRICEALMRKQDIGNSWLILGLLALAGCGAGSDDDWSGTIETLPNGVVRVSNPASNPELLDKLAEQFTAYGYDFKKLVRDICTSRTYQLSTRPNETNESDGKNFSHAAIRRILAALVAATALDRGRQHGHV